MADTAQAKSDSNVLIASALAESLRVQALESARIDTGTEPFTWK